jgi:hypothetical protein
VLSNLNGEIVLVAVFVGAITAFIVDADDVVDAAAVSWNRNHRRVGALPRVGVRR